MPPLPSNSAKPSRELALAAEMGDRLAQLLDAAKAGQFVADVDEHADDARIVGRLPQELDGFDDVALCRPNRSPPSRLLRVVSGGTSRRSSDRTRFCGSGLVVNGAEAR